MFSDLNKNISRTSHPQDIKHLTRQGCM